MTLKIALQLLVNGILIGGVYGILSIGLTMIFGVMRVVNFAHGEFIMLAMYATYWLGFLHDGSLFSIIFVVPAFFLLGFLVCKYLINPIIANSELSQMFTTMGMGIVMQNAALIAWQADPRNESATQAPLKLGFILISYPRLKAFIVAGIVIALLSVILAKTYVGKAIRAAAQNRKAVAIVGVNLGLINCIAFGIGIALAGVSGVVLLPIYSVYPTIGVPFVLICFVVVVIGGLGSIPGALLGGLLIGIVESFTGFVVDPSLKSVVYFVIFVLVLLIRPKGFLGTI
jgi:branched-chain amino acid transport system permease protein